jgi:hypothetical protein
MAKAKKKSRSRSQKLRASAPGGVEEQESVAKSLIEKLGLYEEFPAIHDGESDAKGDVESESS